MGFVCLFNLAVKRNEFLRDNFFFLTLIYLLFLLIINFYLSHYFPDSFLYFILLTSIVLIFFYLYQTEEVFIDKLVNLIFFAGVVNIIFSILEIVLKKSGIFNLELVPYSFYINNRPEVGGILYQTSFNALFLNTTAFLSIYYLFKREQKKMTEYFFIIIYVAAISLSIYTSARAAMVAMFFSMVIFFTIATFKHFDRAFRRKIVLLFGLYIVLLIINSTLLSFGPIEKFQLRGSEDYSTLSRFNIWFTQVLMFLDYPFFGVGLDNFKYLNASYQVESVKILKLPFEAIGNFTTGHNEFLQLFCEGGLFLTIPLLYVFYRGTIKIIKKIDERSVFLFLILIIFTIQSMFTWELRHPALMFIFILISAYLLRKEKATAATQSTKWIHFILPVIFIVIYTVFFTSYGKAITTELYYLPKAKSEKNFFNALLYLDRFSKNPYLYYGADDTFIRQAFLYMSKDVFNSKKIPLTKELFEKLDKEKLFHYDKLALLNLTEEKAKKLNNLRKYWLYSYVISFCEILKGNYKEAYLEAKKAEQLKPYDDSIFALTRFANILAASKAQGVEVQSLLPSEKDIKKMEKNFNELMNKEVRD
jgi:O-antigen ligase